jgi:isobutyryl-CoA mutase
MEYGITRIYSPDDGRAMGLQGMINDLVEKSDVPSGEAIDENLGALSPQNPVAIARIISAAENYNEKHRKVLDKLEARAATSKAPVLGITGTGGSGKSSIVDEMVRRLLQDFPEKTIGIISVDPSKRKTGGALLGDRIRMNAINHPGVYMRSLATRQSNLALSAHVKRSGSHIKVSRLRPHHS